MTRPASAQPAPADGPESFSSLLKAGRRLHPGVRIGRPGRSRMYWVTIAILRLLRFHLKVHFYGSEQVRRGPAIIISNHVAALDPVALVMSNWWRVTAFTKVEVFSGRGSFFFRWMGQIPLRRGDQESTDWAMRMARSALEFGGMIGLYPEGTRSPDGRLHKLHKRVLVPLIQANPETPVHVVAMHHRRRRFRRTQVTAHISGPVPLYPETDTPAQLTNRIRDALMEVGGQEYVDEYARDVKKQSIS